MSDITKRFTTEVVTRKRAVIERIKDPKTGRPRAVRKLKEVNSEVTVIKASDFNELVRELFQFEKPTRRYDVRLDLWSRLQRALDIPFQVSERTPKDLRAAIDNFKQSGHSVGKVRHLLAFFVQEKILAPGNYVIRFVPADREVEPR